jgi:tetratricopeptide (TPR) repeat protein
LTGHGAEQRPRADSAGAGRLGRCVILVLLAVGLGCSGLIGGPADDHALVEPAEALLQKGDLPAAAEEYKRLYAEKPDSVAVAVGFAYVQLLANDIVGADTTLAAIEPKSGDKVGEIRLRRALVALEAQDLERVQMLGLQSELPEGKLLAAEVHLVELHSEEAIPLFREVSETGGVVGETATTYLKLLESTDQHKASLADASALWALGDRAGACDAVKESLKALAEDDPDKDALLLLWAGRAVVSGRIEVAKSLLEDAFAPEGQQWRVQSTLAMIALAEGRVDDAKKIFQALREDPKVPKAGLEDALATACGVVRDPVIAQELLENVESAAAARCLSAVGAEGAAGHAIDGPLKNFVENP